MDYNAQIASALVNLKSQKHVNYSATARKWNIERTTLAKHKGQTSLIKEMNSAIRQRVTDQQERALIEQINKLTLRGMPPTSRIARNFAEEIAGSKLGKNWHENFLRRHKNKLTSLYLRNIDNMSKKADYASSFGLFYDLVSVGFGP